VSTALLPPDSPVAVLASGAAGLTVAGAVARRLPHEDLVVLIDSAYAPYARRQPRLVVDRVLRLTDELLTHAPKLVVLAGAQATADALDAARRRCPVPMVGLDGLVTRAAAEAPGGPVAVVTGDGCMRGLQQAKSIRRQRGGTAIICAWAGLAELVEAGRPLSAEARALVARELERLDGVGTILLACPHAAAVRPLVDELTSDVAVVDCAEIAAERVVQTLRRAAALARRRRPGRRMLVSTDPVRSAGGLRRPAALVMAPPPVSE
jgi:glutamate racemase